MGISHAFQTIVKDLTLTLHPSIQGTMHTGSGVVSGLVTNGNIQIRCPAVITQPVAAVIQRDQAVSSACTISQTSAFLSQ